MVYTFSSWVQKCKEEVDAFSLHGVQYPNKESWRPYRLWCTVVQVWELAPVPSLVYSIVSRKTVEGSTFQAADLCVPFDLSAWVSVDIGACGAKDQANGHKGTPLLSE